MLPHVVKAEYRGEYKIWIMFNDGKEGVVDLKSELYGKMFAPLLDFNQFSSFRVDHELDTIVWPNGADFAPEFLYEAIKPVA